jgi:2-phospho-L-lactate guanylyltransferase
MSCWALVPIKSRADCKGRLAGWLAPAVRLDIVRTMLGTVLAALRESRSIDRVAVVSPERDSVPEDVLVIGDSGRGLNSALDAARTELVARGADELVVLPADLPLLTAADVDLLVTQGRRAGFALATDADGTGTNALYLSRPGVFRFGFGTGSRSRHLEEAARLGWTAEVVCTRGLEFDLDRAEDLAWLRAQGDARFASQQVLQNGDTWLPQTRFGLSRLLLQGSGRTAPRRSCCATCRLSR